MVSRQYLDFLDLFTLEMQEQSGTYFKNSPSIFSFKIVLPTGNRGILLLPLAKI